MSEIYVRSYTLKKELFANKYIAAQGKATNFYCLALLILYASYRTE